MYELDFNTLVYLTHETVAFLSPSRNPLPEGRKPDSNLLLMSLGGVTSAIHLGGLNFEGTPCISQLCSHAFSYSERKKTNPFFLFSLRATFLQEAVSGRDVCWV